MTDKKENQTQISVPNVDKDKQEKAEEEAARLLKRKRAIPADIAENVREVFLWDERLSIVRFCKI